MLALGVAVPLNAAQADNADDLDKIEQTLSEERKRARSLEEKAARLSAEANSLRKEMIAVARKTQQHEVLISTLEQQLTDLRREQAGRREDLGERRRQLSGTLGALSRLPQDPSQTFFLFPGQPLEAVRSAMLLRSAVPALRERANILRDELTALHRVEQDIAGKLDDLETAEAALEDERARMAALLQKKEGLARQFSSKRDRSVARAEELAARARSLKDLIRQLNRVRPAPKPAPQQADDGFPRAPVKPGTLQTATVTATPDDVRPFPAKGPLDAPVAGRVIHRYGADLGFGQTSKGLTIRARRGAQVIAPHDGQISFAGPFRDHGLILIIEHRGGYHTVLAGFERLDVVTGQWLLAGEPIGILATSGKERPPELYVELRRDGQPVNPLKWFSTASIKVHG